MARVRLSQAARADIRAIYKFGVLGFGVRQADVYASRLRQAINTLGEFPEAFRIRPELERSVRVRPHGSHIIVYVYDEHGVHVLRVRHGAEDWTADTLGYEP